MRSIASCYSEHAIKVSDSYCSGASKHAYVSPNVAPSIPKSVSCVYRGKREVVITLTWCIGQGLTVGAGQNSYQVRNTKGSKTFQSYGSEIDVRWDLSGAQYDAGPEPVSGFYVAVLVDSELGVLLGDKSRDETECPGKLSLICRKEQFGGGGVYSTKGQFRESGEEHEIVIRCWRQMLSVSIDNKNILEVKRLRWNFRGNETIFMEGLLVDLMWDVHEWLLNPDSGCAVFLFRTRTGVDTRLWLLQDNASSQIDFSFFICVSN